jgi:uncharacterized membrane protein YozB (DUF420 family)
MAQNVNIPNNMVLAILSIFCCWPLAIFAIINAVKVNNLVAEGKYGEAQEAGAKAKKFAIIAIVLWLVFFILGGIITAVLFGLGLLAQ